MFCPVYIALFMSFVQSCLCWFFSALCSVLITLIYFCPLFNPVYIDKFLSVVQSCSRWFSSVLCSVPVYVDFVKCWPFDESREAISASLASLPSKVRSVRLGKSILMYIVQCTLYQKSSNLTVKTESGSNVSENVWFLWI